ncbi:MAG: hypothetical protein M0D57_05130 [Sphingobacteriales bacterium JAD_PAG50586_3]|nr:MAG: hypothetical protein M0D57_05130 [Sphingobacteriales bacterium JAD_PAG50586_3]
MKILILCALTAAIGLVACNSKSTTKETPKGLVVATDTASVKYQCPMKCQGDTAYTAMGKCPVCEMDLEKVK